MTPEPDGPRSDETDAALGRPNPARIYDFVLGGSANFEVDRAAARTALRTDPEGYRHARSARAFLRRAVTFLARQGIHQFLDLGSGIPTAGNVHETVRRIDPSARVVYVDNEPVAATYSQALLADTPGIDLLRWDMRDPDGILDHCAAHSLLDLDRPVAVCLFASLHFVVDDDEAARLVASLRDRTAPGSHLALSHVNAENRPEFLELEQQYRRDTTAPFVNRDRRQIERFFDGYRLVEPGVVFVSDWHPDAEPDLNAVERPGIAGGVGRLPG